MSLSSPVRMRKGTERTRMGENFMIRNQQNMALENSFLWPERSKMVFRSARGKIYLQSRDRRLDLADSLMMYACNRTVYFDIATNSRGWNYWDDEKVCAIESLIRDDLEFDGYRVRIIRMLSAVDDYPCASPFSWKLEIRSR